jgi:hypothetical protein
MSGGKFDYVEYKLNDVADEIENILRNQGKNKPEDELCYDDEDKCYPVYSESVNDIFKQAVVAIKLAFIYIHRIDYYLSGDDSEESMTKRLLEDLIELNGEDCLYQLDVEEGE